MSNVVMHNVVSVDGYIADDKDDVGPLFEWYSNGDVDLAERRRGQGVAGVVRLRPADVGQHRVDGDRATPVRHDERLGGHATGGEHVGVVSHRPKPEGWHPEASYHSSTSGGGDRGGEGARGRAHRCGGGGNVGGQALALGLVDEVAMDVVPVVFGSGKRYFGPVDGQHLLEDPDVVIRGDRVLHLRYRVRR